MLILIPILVLGLHLSVLQAATIYKCRDASGNITFSNIQCEGEVESKKKYESREPTQQEVKASRQRWKNANQWADGQQSRRRSAASSRGIQQTEPSEWEQDLQKRNSRMERSRLEEQITRPVSGSRGLTASQRDQLLRLHGEGGGKEEEQITEPTESQWLHDPFTGNTMPRTGGGYTDPRTGTFYHDTGGGVVNTRTGEFTPTH